MSAPSKYRLPTPLSAVSVPNISVKVLTRAQVFPSTTNSSSCEPSQTSIIPAQVSLSAIHRSASRNIYSSEVNYEQISQSARQLDEELTVWKATLPRWLNPDVVSFKEPEWMSKQKLALQIGKIRLSFQNCS
jgi:hypothetical protein